MIIMIRHGSTKNNELGIVQGNSRLSLSERGLREAHFLAEHLTTKNIRADSLLVSSSQARAIATANVVASALQLEVIVSDLIVERNFGSLDGMTQSDLLKERQSRGFSDGATSDWWESQPDIEAPRDVFARVQQYWEEINVWERATSDTVLMVTHSGVIRSVLQELLESRVKHDLIQISTGGYISLDIQSGAFRLAELWPNPCT